MSVCVQTYYHNGTPFSVGEGAYVLGEDGKVRMYFITALWKNDSQPVTMRGAQLSEPMKKKRRKH